MWYFSIGMWRMKKNNKIFKAFKYLINDVIVPNVIWFGLGLVAVSIIGSAKTLIALLNYLSKDTIAQRECIIALVSIVVCLFGGIIGIICLVKSKNGFNFQIASTYTIVDSEFELFFETREIIVNRQKISFMVTASSLDKIVHTMTWTGSKFGKCDLDDDSKRRGFELKEVKKSAEIHVYHVVFPREYQFGEKDSYIIETHVEDANHSMLPFLSRHIKCQTDLLKLKITAPIGMIKNCEYFISVDQEGEMKLSEPLAVDHELVGNYYCYKQQVSDLDMLRFYRISWQFCS